MKRLHYPRQLFYGFALYAGFLLVSNYGLAAESPEAKDPAEVSLGERLFLETRFAQAWYANPGKAEPVLEYTQTTAEPMRGAFAGKTISCRACHMVDEYAGDPQGGMRTYADFARRSPIPQRNDGQYTSARNSMSLVGISVSRENPRVFHFDGEFNSMPDLVLGTLIDRNYGWLHSQRALAIKHIANVIRQDDGQDDLGREFGGRYSKLLTGTANDIKPEFRLPMEYRIDVARASDEDIVRAVAKLIAAYVNNLAFVRDDNNVYDGSPYDQFLKKNALPRKPAKHETAAAYSRRLARAIKELQSPRFISSKDGKFKSHVQKFIFGKKELAGMQLFFRQGSAKQRGGNCIACHVAPNFSDFGFHNTGIAQMNYDAVHGSGAFNKLSIPNLHARNNDYDNYLPATARHPEASGKFRSPVDHNHIEKIDLGLWNVFANPDMPGPQAKLTEIICRQAKRRAVNDCRLSNLLPLTIGAFKTPMLRDLGHSAPYMHSGQITNLKEAIQFYINSSALAKSNKLRNSADELKEINLATQDIELLVAFIKSLNEDYE